MAHGINRRLVFDYQQYLQQPFNLDYIDMKSCYDQIVHPSTSLDLQPLGIPLLEIIIMIDTIQRMSHTVRTSHSDSNLK